MDRAKDVALGGSWRPPPSLASQMGKDQGSRSDATVWPFNAPEAKKKKKDSSNPPTLSLLPPFILLIRGFLKRTWGPCQPIHL